MEDPMAKALAAYWNEDVEGEWEDAVSRFALKSKADRVSVLQKCDEWLTIEAKPTKEYASMWQRKRDLEQLHWRLDRAGK
jgi:hypothetical protein